MPNKFAWRCHLFYTHPSKCSSKIVVMSSAVSSAKEATGKSRKRSDNSFFMYGVLVLVLVRFYCKNKQ